MTKYEFVTPKLYGKLKPEVAGEELERIRAKYGTLDPALVVNESRDDESVLHNVFCWDDSRAAELWRNKQAGDLIRNIQVVVTNEDVKIAVRAFVNVRSNPEGYRSYMPITEAIKNNEAYKDLLAQAKADMDGFVSKYSQISELNAVKAEMLKVLAQ